MTNIDKLLIVQFLTACLDLSDTTPERRHELMAEAEAWIAEEGITRGNLEEVVTQFSSKEKRQ